MDCIFCDIIEGRADAEVLFQNENIISFLDIRPINFGHTLVITKKHYDNFQSVPADELTHLMKGLQFITSAVVKSVKADGFNLIVNSGKAAGQTIFHFHFHIIPRYLNDFRFKPDFKSYSDGSMKEFADKIRAEINKQKDSFNV
ncbi:MAG TPA: HIT family protein [Ignavibacteriaceae bacterium]|nr:HIT family protein [Ignavibacteriaceae bacterium]